MVVILTSILFAIIWQTRDEYLAVVQRVYFGSNARDTWRKNFKGYLITVVQRTDERSGLIGNFNVRTRVSR